MRQQLATILTDKDRTPPSTTVVARQLGIGVSSIIHHCPDQYRLLVDRYQHAKRVQRKAQRALFERHLRAALRSKTTPPLSLTDVARELHCRTHKLVQIIPQLSRKLLLRFKAWQIRRRSRAEAKLKAVLASAAVPPPSMAMVAAALHENEQYLYQLSPTLYRAINARYRAYSQSQAGHSPARRAGSAVASARKRTKSPADSRLPPALRANRLREILADRATPCPTLTQVALQMGITTAPLTKQQPALAAAIIRRHKAERRAITRQREAYLRKLVTENPTLPPSFRDVARHLGLGDTGMLRRQYPELSRIIIVRYKAR